MITKQGGSGTADGFALAFASLAQFRLKGCILRELDHDIAFQQDERCAQLALEFIRKHSG